MHSDTGMLGKFQVNLVGDQMQRGLALKEVGSQSGIGFVHATPRMEAPSYQNPWSELCFAAFIGDIFKATGHTATQELRCPTCPTEP